MLVNHPTIVVRDFLSPEECRRHIAAAEARGFRSAGSDYPPSYRNNDRLVIDDAALAGDLFRRVRGLAPEVIEGGWHLEGINPRFRLCRYLPGQRFSIHQDGVHYREPGCRSWLTFMIYLTDGTEFEGGGTLFYAAGPGAAPQGADAPPVVARLRPRAGMLILFDHAVWHAGDTLTRGSKHILRSELLYRRAGALAEPAGAFQPAHQGYVWTMARLSGGRVASGGRDASIRLWSNDGAPLGRLAGHRQSVLGLAQYASGCLASVSRDRSLRLWNAEALACEHAVIAHRSAVLAVAALPGKRLATGAADHAVKLWSCERGAPREIHALEGHAGWVWALAPAGAARLASASEDGSLRLWDTERFECLAVLAAGRPLRTLDVSPDGALLAAGDISGEVTLWKTLERPVLVGRFRAHAAAVRRVRFFDASTLATAGEDNRLRVWRAADASLLDEAPHDNFVTDVLPPQDGRYLSCSYDGSIAAHRVSSRR